MADKAMPEKETTHQQVGKALDEGWIAGGGFVSSILAGFLLGYLADRWLGTDPWLVISGIVVGAYNGFVRMWIYANREEQEGGR